MQIWPIYYLVASNYMWKTGQIFVVFLEYLKFKQILQFSDLKHDHHFSKMNHRYCCQNKPYWLLKNIASPQQFPNRIFNFGPLWEGAQTTIYCCVDKGAVKNNGHYFVDCQKKDIFPWLIDDRKQKLCWDVSKKLVKFD